MDRRRALVLSLAVAGLPAAARAESTSFTPVVLAQVWGTAWDQDLDAQADPAGYGDPEDDPGFRIRRARLGGYGEHASGLWYAVVFGVSSPYDVWTEGTENVRLVDGALGWHDDVWRVSAGQQKVPVSREQLIAAADLVFTERAVSTMHLAPDRETGVAGSWAASGVTVRAGVFNGSGSFLGEDDRGLMMALRAEFAFGEPAEVLRTWGTVDRPTLGVGADALYDDDLSTRSVGYGADVLFRVSGLAVLLEGRWSTLTPNDAGVAVPEVLVETDRIGGLAQVGWTLGSLEPAVRASWFDDARAVTDNGDVLEVVGGVTWHQAQDVGRLGVGFVHRAELGGRTLPNDTARVWAQVRY